MLKVTTEMALFKCFDEELFAFKPLTRDDRLGNAPFPISFFFGTKDWMSQNGVELILRKNKYWGVHSHLYLV